MHCRFRRVSQDLETTVFKFGDQVVHYVRQLMKCNSR